MKDITNNTERHEEILNIAQYHSLSVIAKRDESVKIRVSYTIQSDNYSPTLLGFLKSKKYARQAAILPCEICVKSKIVLNDEGIIYSNSG